MYSVISKSSFGRLTKPHLVLLPAVVSLAMIGQAAHAQSVTLENFEGSTAGQTTGYDNFAIAFPTGTSPVTNFAGTAGYGENGSLTGSFAGFPMAAEGSAYGLLHSAGEFGQEVVQAELGTGGRPELFANLTYQLRFSATWLDVTAAGGQWNAPGSVHIYGIRTGTSPSITTTDQSTIAANPSVDLLAATPVFELADFGSGFMDFSFTVLTQHGYDRLLVVPASETPSSAVGKGFFAAIDNITYEPVPAISATQAVSIADNGDGIDSPGDTVTVTVTVTNTGNIQLTNVTLDDALYIGDADNTDVSDNTAISDPANATFVSSTGGSPVGTLNPGESATYTYTYTVDDPDFDAGSIVGEVQATGTPLGETDTVSSETILSPLDYDKPEIEVSSSVNGDIADAGTDAQGNQPVNEPQTITYTIANDGDEVLTLGTPTVTDGANTLGTPTVSAPGLSSLAPGEETTITVTYTPENLGAFDFDIVVPNNDTDEGPYNIEVSGNSDGDPEISVETSNGDVDIADEGTDTIPGTQTAGEAQTVIYTITNDGTDTLTLGTPTVAAGDNISGTPTVSAPGLSSLAPGETTTITVTYTPENAGPFNLDLVVPNDDADEAPYNIEVVGTADGDPEITVETSNGDVEVADEGNDTQPAQPAGVEQTITYTIINDGTDTLTLGTPTLVDGANTVGTPTVSAPGTSSLEPGETTTITVTYTPENDGPYDFDIVVPNNDADENPYNIEVTGSSDGDPEIDISSSVNGDIADGGSDAQGSQPAGVEQTITYTITNDGTDTLTLDGTPTVSGETNITGPVTVGAPASLSLAPGETTTFTVAYTPTIDGPFDFDIAVGSNDADEAPYDIAVAGSSTGDPEIEISSSVNGDIADGGTDDQGSPDLGVAQTITYTITNDGLDTLILDGTPTVSGVSNIVGGDGGVTVGAPGSLSLAPGETTTFTVTYTPEVEGDFGFDVDVLSNDADESPYDIAVAGTAAGVVDIEVIENILSDDLLRTTTILSSNASNISRRAADRLRVTRGQACGQEINDLLQNNPVRFASDKFFIDARNDGVLDEIARLLGDCAGSSFMIAGHTDSDASDAYNVVLSQNRVDAVRAALAKRGVAVERLQTQGFGESRPIASNGTEEGQALNRRVEFILLAEVDAVTPACGDGSQLSRNVNGSGNDDGARLNGDFASTGYNCATDTYSETWGELSVTHDEDRGTLGVVTVGTSRERQSDNALFGRFIEASLSKSDVDTEDATGTITGVGLHAGLYGANGTEGGLILSYYGSAAIGQHSFEIDTGAVADGRYTYAGIFAGAAVGGEHETEELTFRPRVGIDLAYSKAIGSEISVPDVELEIDPATYARGFVELGISHNTDNATFDVAPRLFCTTNGDTDADACGYGASFKYATLAGEDGTQWDVTFDYEQITDTQTASLRVARSQEIFDGLGVSKSSFGATQAGGFEVAQTVEFSW